MAKEITYTKFCLYSDCTESFKNPEVEEWRQQEINGKQGSKYNIVIFIILPFYFRNYVQNYFS